MKKNITKRMISALLVLCLTLALCPITALAADKSTGTGATTATAKTSSFSVTNTLKGFGVNQLASRGLSAAATLLSWAAEESGNEGFQEAVSCINQWVFGVSDNGTGEIKELCNQILNELDALETSMNTRFEQLESMLREVQKNQYAMSFQDAWTAQVQDAMNDVDPMMYEAVEAFRNYYALAIECGPNGTQEQKLQVKTAYHTLYTMFTQMIDVPYAYSPEQSVDAYYLQKVYLTTEVDDNFAAAINKMLGELLITGNEIGGTRYVDLAAQMTFLTCPSTAQQADFVDLAMQKQTSQITLTVMAYQEFMNMRAEYFRTLDTTGLDSFYNTCRDNMNRLLVGRSSADDENAGTASPYGSVTAAMENWLNGKIYLDSDGSDYLYLDDYIRADELHTVTLTNQSHKSSVNYNFYRNAGFINKNFDTKYFSSQASVSKKSMTFQKVGFIALNPNGGRATVKTFYTLEGNMSDLLKHTGELSNGWHIYYFHLPSCNYYNLAQGNFTDADGTVCRLATPDELRQITSTFSYSKVGSTPAGYFSMSASTPLYLLSRNTVGKEDKAKWYFLWNEYTTWATLPLFNMSENRSLDSTWSTTNLRVDEISGNARFAMILVADTTSKVSAALTNDNAATFQLSGNGTAQGGSRLTLTVTPNNGTTITGIKLRYPNSSRKEEVYLTSSQIAEMIDPKTGVLTLSIRVPYDDVQYIIEVQDFDENGFSRSTGDYQPAPLAKDGYYEISNVGQFFWFAAQVNIHNPSINGRIMAPLDISASLTESWNPMGTAEYPYSGIFDGGNYPITNLNNMLFGTTNGATIQNIAIESGCISEYPDSAIATGSIAGQMLHSTLAHSYSKATIENSYSCNVGDVGGLIGWAEDVQIMNCYYVGSITNQISTGMCTSESDCIDMGGLVGAGMSLMISDCYSYACIEGGDCIGGLIGRDIVSSSYIINSYFCWTSKIFAAVGDGYIPDDVHEVFAEDFANGVIASLLNGGASEGIWKQTIGTDEYPVFANP